MAHCTMQMKQSSIHSFAKARPVRTHLHVSAATTIPSQYKVVKPVADRVLVKVDKDEIKSVGGLLLPTSAQKKPTTGSIVAAGDARLVKVGDRVLYSKFAGTEMEVGGEPHVLLKEEDVVGLMTDSMQITEMKPLSDRVLIQCATAENKSAGGVLLTSESEKPTFGKVVAVGPGRKKEDSEEVVTPNVTVGSTVLYSKYTGVELMDDNDVAHIIVRETDIIAALAS